MIFGLKNGQIRDYSELKRSTEDRNLEGFGTPTCTFYNRRKHKNRRKGNKERKSIYIAPLYSISKGSDMDHTVLPANYTMPAFLS